MSIYARHARRSQRTMQQHYALRRFLLVWSTRWARNRDQVLDLSIGATAALICVAGMIAVGLVLRAMQMGLI